jgi:hypothetical protein
MKRIRAIQWRARPVPLRPAVVLLALLALGAADAPRPVDPPRNPHSADAWTLPEGEPTLPAGDPDAALVKQHCLLCHSPDYISTQPRLSRAGWQANVDKMRSKYGAPIPTNAVPALVDYLVTHHGKP